MRQTDGQTGVLSSEGKLKVPITIGNNIMKFKEPSLNYFRMDYCICLKVTKLPLPSSNENNGNNNRFVFWLKLQVIVCTNNATEYYMVKSGIMTTENDTYM